MELLLTGARMSAEEAYHCGLIGVVDDGGALESARAWADQIAANGPLAVQSVLASVRAAEGLSDASGRHRRRSRQPGTLQSDARRARLSRATNSRVQGRVRRFIPLRTRVPSARLSPEKTPMMMLSAVLALAAPRRVARPTSR